LPEFNIWFKIEKKFALEEAVKITEGEAKAQILTVEKELERKENREKML
jgi:hypothetical protein